MQWGVHGVTHVLMQQGTLQACHGKRHLLFNTNTTINLRHKLLTSSLHFTFR
jgi:hypothetical protein